MKKLVTLALILSGSLSGVVSLAQTFTVSSHVVPVIASGGSATGVVKVNIPSGSPTITRQVIACDFPADWLGPTVFGFCDQALCGGNLDDILWSKTKSSGHAISFYHDPSDGWLSLSLTDLAGKTTGCFYATVQFKDVAVGGTVDTVRYNICYNPLSVPAQLATSDIVIYPNPASDVLYLAGTEGTGISTAAIYDLAGRALQTSKVTGNTTEIATSNIPNGIYFVKLYDASGNMVTTRKFVKQ